MKLPSGVGGGVDRPTVGRFENLCMKMALLRTNVIIRGRLFVVG